ncbi:MAG: ABC transporter substrate-binding protein [Propionibacteriaceae bacterium]|jgi:NitT/TauT family transport system substrate-binding protein|nr:ABC transporter substrate-binding protein [Propionibacteriaceae bacterium]
MRRIAFAVAALLLAGCAGPAPAQTTADTVTLGMSYIPNIQFAPFYVAKASGKLDGIELRHHGSGESLFGALSAGQEQFVVATGDEAMQAAAEGVDVVAIAPYYLEYPVKVLTLASSGISTLADLKGKKLGVPGRYGESWFAALLALKTAGLSESEVEIVEIGYTLQAAVTTGKVDAAMGFSNNDLVQLQLAGMDVRALDITDGEPPLVGASVFTTRAFMASNPKAVEQVKKATAEGIDAVAADPAAAIETSASQIADLDKVAAEATLKATIAVMAPDGKAATSFDTGKWEKMGEFMLAAGLINAIPDPLPVVGD